MKRKSEKEILDYIQVEDCKNWYKSFLVKKNYCKTAAMGIKALCGQTHKLPNIKVDEKCTYNKGKREYKRDEIKPFLGDYEKLIHYLNFNEEGKKTNRHEERLCHYLYAQQFLSDYEVIDFQIPTTNSGHDKIDLLLKRDNEVIMVEAKKFSLFEKQVSEETLLRCALEIQTYYQKINESFMRVYEIAGKDNLKKAILVDKDSLAYRQKDEKWAKEILKYFDISLFELSKAGDEFVISRVEID